MTNSPLTNIVIVLHRPQDAVNVGAVVRAMKNMGLARLRLVAPARLDHATLLRVAHRCEDLIDTAEIYDDLDAALADAVLVVGSAAQRPGPRPYTDDVRSLAGRMLQQAGRGPVALLFGPEDDGLDGAALDRCHLIAGLSADPAYPALNLAQAALLFMYELRMAHLGQESGVRSQESGAPAPTTARSTPSPPASAGELETLFAAAERALHAVAFFKSGNGPKVMGELRRIAHRANLDRREAALLAAMAREVVAFLRRRASAASADRVDSAD